MKSGIGRSNQALLTLAHDRLSGEPRQLVSPSTPPPHTPTVSDSDDCYLYIYK